MNSNFECQCPGANKDYPCKERATQEDMLCDICREGRCGVNLK